MAFGWRCPPYREFACLLNGLPTNPSHVGGVAVSGRISRRSSTLAPLVLPRVKGRGNLADPTPFEHGRHRRPCLIARLLAKTATRPDGFRSRRARLIAASQTIPLTCSPAGRQVGPIAPGAVTLSYPFSGGWHSRYRTSESDSGPTFGQHAAITSPGTAWRWLPAPTARRSRQKWAAGTIAYRPVRPLAAPRTTQLQPLSGV